MSATLESLLEPLPWLEDPAVEDVCINGPGECWVYSHGQFTRHDVPELADPEDIDDIAIVAGAQRQRDIGHDKPILGVDLVGRNGRLHAIADPCVEGCTNITIRRGSDEWPTIPELAEARLFRNIRRGRRSLPKGEDRLYALYQRITDTTSEDELTAIMAEFLPLAVRLRKTIVIAGENATGKTHVSKALIKEIPLERRVITIENAKELRGLPHPNKVQFYYHKDEEDGIKPTDLVEAALRFRIGTLFLQEIRDGWETLAFLVANQTGHKGAITTIHAGHCRATFERMKVAIKMVAPGAAIEDTDVMAQLKETVDIVLHTSRPDTFAVDEIWCPEYDE